MSHLIWIYAVYEFIYFLYGTLILLHSERPKLYTYCTQEGHKCTPIALRKTKLVYPLHSERPKLCTYCTQKGQNCTPPALRKATIVHLLHSERPNLYTYCTQKGQNCIQFGLSDCNRVKGSALP